VLLMAATIITVIGPLILLVRLYFVPQLVVLEGKRGVDALRASWELTRGFSLRVAGVLLVGQVLYTLAGGLIATPVAAVAREVDSSALSLAATAVGETLAVAPIGIFAALLYFDLRSRQAALVR
jgi:membrane-anchored glycerophosphoryl diester phosphodiesterase (GDPDase)